MSNKQRTSNPRGAEYWRAGCACARVGLCYRCQAADEIERLEESVRYWQADSAAAWDKCEERRLAVETPAPLTGVAFLKAWMSAANPQLGNWTPLQMLDAGKGEKLAAFIREASADSAENSAANLRADEPTVVRACPWAADGSYCGYEGLGPCPCRAAETPSAEPSPRRPDYISHEPDCEFCTTGERCTCGARERWSASTPETPS